MRSSRHQWRCRTQAVTALSSGHALPVPSLRSAPHISETLYAPHGPPRRHERQQSVASAGNRRRRCPSSGPASEAVKTDPAWTPHGRIGRPTAGARRVLSRVAPFIRAAFRPRLHGAQNLPVGRPYLLVANHSAGLAVAELPSFALMWAEAFDDQRPLAGFAHPGGYRLAPIRNVHLALGSVPSTYEAAYAALDEGAPLLVFPGGDVDSFRPVWRANRVDFGGRRGFLRIAREAGVPVVPMGIHGSHYTVPILVRGSRWLAWLLLAPRLSGAVRWGLSLTGVVGAMALLATPIPVWLRCTLAYLWLGSPLTMLPVVPTTITFRVGAAIEPEELFTESDPDLDHALRRVEQTIERLVRSSRAESGAR